MSFAFEEAKLLNSPYIEKIWRVQTDYAGHFVSTANTHSEIVVATVEGKTTVSVRGPETKATLVPSPPAGEFLGIVFRLGAFMPSLPPQDLTDQRDVDLPVVRCGGLWLDNAVWEIPDFDNADTFAERLIQEGLIMVDQIVSSALQGRPQTLSPRALQYRFLRTTGLSQKLIQQIERAERAAELLQRGISIIDAAHQTGYADQSHMTNAFRRFLGQTPAQLVQVHQPG